MLDTLYPIFLCDTNLQSESDPRNLPTFQIARLHQIARTLFQVPHHRKGKLARRAHSYLGGFSEALGRLKQLNLERKTASSEDDEERFMQWAKVKDLYILFVQPEKFV